MFKMFTKKQDTVDHLMAQNELLINLVNQITLMCQNRRTSRNEIAALVKRTLEKDFPHIEFQRKEEARDG